jgi:hypothetical protein
VVIWHLFPRFDILCQEKSGVKNLTITLSLPLLPGKLSSSATILAGSARTISPPQEVRGAFECSDDPASTFSSGADFMKPFRPKFTDKAYLGQIKV